MKKKKRPAIARDFATSKLPATASAQPVTEKRPSAAIFTSSNDGYPSWRIGRLETADPFGWHEVSGEKILDIRGKLANFETMTWNDILVKGKKNHHSVPVEKLCSSARKRLAEIRLESLDELVSLHLSGTERVWGYREGAVLHVLWWDPDHEVYPSPLKHT